MRVFLLFGFAVQAAILHEATWHEKSADPVCIDVPSNLDSFAKKIGVDSHSVLQTVKRLIYRRKAAEGVTPMRGFEVQGLLGSGGYGCVYAVTYNSELADPSTLIPPSKKNLTHGTVGVKAVMKIQKFKWYAARGEHHDLAAWKKSVDNEVRGAKVMQRFGCRYLAESYSHTYYKHMGRENHAMTIELGNRGDLFDFLSYLSDIDHYTQCVPSPPGMPPCQRSVDKVTNIQERLPEETKKYFPTGDGGPQFPYLPVERSDLKTVKLNLMVPARRLELVANIARMVLLGIVDLNRPDPGNDVRKMGVAFQKGYVHRDVKFENVLLDISDGRFRVMLADPGMVAQEGDKFANFGGTTDYMPPEYLAKQPRSRVPDPRHDVYSVGVMLQRMVEIVVDKASREPGTVVYVNAERLNAVADRLTTKFDSIPGPKAALAMVTNALQLCEAAYSDEETVVEACENLPERSTPGKAVPPRSWLKAIDVPEPASGMSLVQLGEIVMPEAKEGEPAPTAPLPKDIDDAERTSRMPDRDREGLLLVAFRAKPVGLKQSDWHELVRSLPDEALIDFAARLRFDENPPTAIFEHDGKAFPVDFKVWAKVGRVSWNKDTEMLTLIGGGAELLTGEDPATVPCKMNADGILDCTANGVSDAVAQELMKQHALDSSPTLDSELGDVSDEYGNGQGLLETARCTAEELCESP